VLYFPTGEVVESLQSSGPPTEANEKVTFIKDVFPKLLAKMLLDNNCYSDLAEFTSIFESLKAQCCKIPGVATPVAQLAQYDLLSMESI
jgi:hypothetical protein